MLSYRHAFHAGNHADVLKHYTLSMVLNYYNQKDRPYSVIDTHAGAGIYTLNDPFAQKNKEYATGIASLAVKQPLPASITQYLEMVQSFNQSGTIEHYPGSPKVAEHFLRRGDQLHLFELHPADHQLLTDHFKTSKHKVMIRQQDGFNGIKACLPPPSRRGVIIIDPPYENKQDYQQVITCLKDSLKRFATGTYLVWYPLLARPEPQQMIDALKALPIESWLNTQLCVTSPTDDGFGMYGSGLFVINPPWTLPNILHEALPVFSQTLGLDQGSNYHIESEIA